jgi:hypothetical protein
MILAWHRDRRTRQASRHNDFSRRKPVAVRTAPAAPPAQPERSGSRDLRSRSACELTGRIRGRFARPCSPRTECRELATTARTPARDPPYERGGGVDRFTGKSAGPERH